MYTIGQLAKKAGLSRSTLLYYDKIGLLRPRGRSDSNYRLYSNDDVALLDKITLYRETGMSLDSIAELLVENSRKDTANTEQINAALEKRLSLINTEIQELRNQQQSILTILNSTAQIRNSRMMTKELWVSILSASGMDDNDMKNWHVAFERSAPEAHQDFLESIGIEEKEIKQIREWSKNG